MRTSITSLPALHRFGRYELLGRLATGGMAEIFLAREPVAEGVARPLVIKRVLPHVADDPRFVEMFFDEARVAMQLSHPGICHIYEFGEEANTYFLAMEWIDGVSLGKLIRRSRRHGGVPVGIAMKVVAMVAEALQHAHHATGPDQVPLGIVHRDVTPGNIMVSFEGGVKLLDFGIAQATTRHTKTEDGQVKGKFAYMSPQQCRGEALDGRADIFSLGVCLYEALTGTPLYHRKTQYETMRVVIEEPPPSIRAINADLPEALDAVVRRALAKNPEQRFQSAAELQEALELLLAGGGRVVHGGRIAEYVKGLFEKEAARGPVVETVPFGESFDSLEEAQGQRPDVPGVGGVDTETFRTTQVASRPVSRLPWFIAGGAVLALLLVVGGGGFLWMGRAIVPPTPAMPVAGPMPVAAPAVPVTPVPAIEVAPTTGTLVLTSTPEGASVDLDGRRVGVTPLTLDGLDVGAHEVRLRKAGRRSWSGTVELEAGATAELDRRLAEVPRAAAPGQVSINTRPWSKVYVGSRLLGQTPIGRASVPSGMVRLRIVDRDGNTHRRSVTVRPGEQERVFFDLEN